MNKYFLMVLMLFNALFTYAQKKKPKLLVMIVVDQMRYDYLKRYEADFGEDGFHRLLNEGISFSNVNYSFKPTYTGPGHATLFTGCTPSTHGIVGNSWYDRALKKSVYCVGTEDSSGNYLASPINIKVDGIADRIKSASNNKAKVFAISLKDRSAIIPGGKNPDAALWFDSKNGKWITSDYYSIEDKDYLKDFNRDENIAKYLDETWKNQFTDKSDSMHWPDTVKYEGWMSEKSGNTFPYNIKEIKDEIGFRVLKMVPAGNDMTLDLALSILENENLAKSKNLDMISISFSVTDYVGHRFGINSLELRNTYYEMDKTIARLLRSLDEEIGEGNYLLALSSDHGAGENPQSCIDNEKEGGFLNPRLIQENLEMGLDTAFGQGEWIEKFTNMNVYWTDSALEVFSHKKEELTTYLDCWIKHQDGLDAYWIVGMGDTNELNLFCENGWYSGRSGDIVFIETYQWMANSNTGTTHGSPYDYDTHVPYIIYGLENTEINPEKNYSVAAMLDILLSEIGIETPEVKE